MAPIPTVADVREWVARSPSLHVDQDRIEVRVLASIVTGGFVISMVEPIFYLFLVPSSLISRVAGLAPSLYCVAAAFVLAVLLTLPHLFALMFLPDRLHVHWPRRIGAAAAVGASVTWLYLAALAVPMDVGGLEWAYVVRAVGSILVGGAYAVSLNAQQLRECLCATHE